MSGEVLTDKVKNVMRTIIGTSPYFGGEPTILTINNIGDIHHSDLSEDTSVKLEFKKSESTLIDSLINQSHEVRRFASAVAAAGAGVVADSTFTISPEATNRQLHNSLLRNGFFNENEELRKASYACACTAPRKHYRNLIM